MLREPERVESLREKTAYCLDRFRKLGFEIGNTSTPIIPLFIRDNENDLPRDGYALRGRCLRQSRRAPAVAPGDTLIRFSLMATHTYEQLDRAIKALVKVFKALDIPLHPQA